MAMLSRNMRKFESWLKTLDGRPFRGVIFPAQEAIPIETYAQPRLLLRTRVEEAVDSGTMIKDLTGRIFLLGDHDIATQAGETFTKTHRLFQMTDYVTWGRSIDVVDTLTGLKRSTGSQDFGRIWASIEVYGRADVDRGTHMPTDRRRLVTGAAIKLGDVIDGNVVRRLNPIFGISLAEIE